MNDEAIIHRQEGKIMKFKNVVFVMILAVVLGTTVWGQRSPRHQVLFERAKYTMETKGDLSGAIALFEEILKKYPEARETAAKAQLHIGLCYEKLGFKEAQKAFQKVIDDYPDQSDAVNTAREKLSALINAKEVIEKREAPYKLSKIYTGSSYPMSVSPDGKKLALLKSEDWDIYLMDIVTQEEVKLTDERNSIEDVQWSPDSKMIAFRDMLGNLYVVSTKGGPPKMIIQADPEAVKTNDEIEISGWTSDSKKIIFQIPSKGLFAVSSAQGVREEIMTFQDSSIAKKYKSMSLSPNAQFIAYDFYQNGNMDIYVKPVKGGESVRITNNPAHDRSPQWSFDGHWIAFYSNRTNRPEAWAIKITADGKPDGKAFQVSKGGILDGSWAKEGKAGYCIAVRTEHVYIANLDGSEEFQLTKFPAFNREPRWSPDGKMIVFGSDYDQSLNTFKLWTIPSNGGQEVPVADVGWELFWSPEREMVTCKILRNNTINFKRSGEGEVFKELVVDLDGEIGSLDWSPDGKKIVFTNLIKPKQYSNVVEYLRNIVSGIGVISVMGGKPTMLIPTENKGIQYGSPRWSPDGKRIAFGTYNRNAIEKGDENEIAHGLWTINAQGGEPELVAKTDRDGYKLCWTTDGKYIITEQRIKDMEFELYKVPADGGTPEKMHILGRSAACSPDGEKIAYSRRLEGFYEYWMVENFLHETKVE